MALDLALIPEVKDVDIAFSTLKTDPKLLEIAKERGFYNGYTEHNKKFSDLFYTGGRIECNPKLPEDTKIRLLRYLKAFMSTFDCKHEEKDAVCALILSELACA
jgi:hypothetical protein